MLHAMYKQTTDAIEVTVVPNYVEEHSRPEDGVYVWAYEIAIANLRDELVLLKNRHWRITNAHGQTLEVAGAGVVGDQPMIRPGETYSYSSYTNLATPSGFMVGRYEMETEHGDTVSVGIPAFSLDSPEQLSLPN
jgi:ApaG protein